MSKVVVTGASGFIGRGVVPALAEAGFAVTAVVRSAGSAAGLGEGVATCVIPDLAKGRHDLADACQGAAMIVHLADNPVRTDEASSAPDLARAVASAASVAGVPRIVLASSIYARLDEGAKPNAYGAGKRAAEQVLGAMPTAQTVTLRLPPVYGPGCKGGFALLVKLVETGFPLPFGLARAPRSYLSRANLALLVVALAQADDAAFAAAAGRVWEPSDGAPVTTAQLARAVAAKLGKRTLLLPVPPFLITGLAALAGKREGAEAVFSSLLCEDSRGLRKAIGWNPAAELASNLGWLER